MMQLPRDLKRRILERRSALVYEAGIEGRELTATDALRKAIAEVALADRVARGLVPDKIEEKRRIQEQKFQEFVAWINSETPATPSPELEEEVKNEVAEYAQLGIVGEVAMKLHRMALNWASSWRNPLPAPSSPVVDPQPESAVKQPRVRPSAKKSKPAPPFEGIGLPIASGGRSAPHWIGGEVPRHSSYGS